ncbi:MAG: DUF1631 domain-containing protein [Pseudomonadota bacterium]|nr:DUF1631 domain-containing protein [Pseudomonadota bacterium]
MPNNTKHIVRLAQQQALSGFAALVNQMLADTDVQIGAALRTTTAAEHVALNGARYWLHEKGRGFRDIMLAKFSVLLERAMETMHTDLRAGLHDIRADMLSLVEDDVMTRQIELDRLAVRLRDVDEISLGRINLTIATLHGVSKVRERENPFRPYLAARALYETLRETAREPAVAKVLFEQMATAMAARLPNYYAAILAHFEARGVDSRLLAQPSEMTRAQRERLNAQYGSGGPDQVQGLQELVRQVLEERPGANVRPAAAARAPANAALKQPPQRSRLDAQLRQLQQTRASDNDAAAPAALTLSEQIGEKADPLDRITIDLVGLVFDYVGRTKLLLPTLRTLLGRLHVPFLRAALLDPDMLQQRGHPARSLLDRLGMLGAAMVPGVDALQTLPAEASRLIEQVRQDFDVDTTVFAHAERVLDSIVDAMLQRANPVYGVLAETIAAADVNGARHAALQSKLNTMLAPLQLDPRLTAFIDTTWTTVMLHQDGAALGAALLPELVWSAQAKTTPADRSVLMRSLPDLVRRIREGILLLGLPAEGSKAALDQLVDIHMDVLGQRIAPGGRSTSLDWLHVHFSQLGVAAAAPAAPLPAAAIEAVLARQGLRAMVHDQPEQRDPAPIDAEWLAGARPGAGYEMEFDGSFVVVRLETASADKSTFIFSTPAPAPPLVCRQNAFLAAMHTGALRPVEYAPLFERAVSSVMSGLGTPT